jgi:hypothetical protein
LVVECIAVEGEKIGKKNEKLSFPRDGLVNQFSPVRK